MAGYNWLETKEKYVKQHDAITASVLLCNHMLRVKQHDAITASVLLHVCNHMLRFFQALW